MQPKTFRLIETKANISPSQRAQAEVLEAKERTKVSVLYDPQNHSKVVLSSGRGHTPSHVAPAPAGVDLDRKLQELYEQSVADTAAGAPIPAAAPADHSQARLDALKQLAELHDHGVLTDDEFAAEKAKILNQA
jgi:hypothetical protein